MEKKKIEMPKKYSPNFERDFKFYFDNMDKFTFCGTLNPNFEAIENTNGKTAKEVFYLIDSTGKNYPTSEPELLNKLLLCKASVNFHIKMWAEGRVDCTLSYIELSEDYKLEYGLPDWVITAVENQKIKLYERYYNFRCKPQGC